MSAYAQMLLEKRANTYEQAKTLLDTAAAEKRDLTAEEQQSYDRMSSDLNDLRSQVDKIIADDRLADEIEESLRKLADQGIDPDKARKSDDEQLRAFLKGEKRDLELKGNPKDLHAMLQTRALGPGSAAVGGATIPTNFYNQLWAHLINASQFLASGITVLTTDSGAPIQLSTTTAHSTASWITAGSAVSESDPAFAQRTLGAYKAGLLLTVDQELINDTGVDLTGYLAMQAGRAVGNLVGSAMVTGTGTTQPTGITTLTTLGVTGATGVTGAPNFDNIINLYYSVIPQYRQSPSAGFVMADSTVGIIRTLKDSYGRYLWSPALDVKSPDTILGKPVVQEVSMPTVALNAKSVIFGDLQAYFARIVNGVRFEMSRDYAFGNDQITYRAILRADGTLLDQTGAVKHFVGAAS